MRVSPLLNVLCIPTFQSSPHVPNVLRSHHCRHCVCHQDHHLTIITITYHLSSKLQHCPIIGIQMYSPPPQPPPNRLLRYIDKYRYFLNIDIPIFDFSIYRNIDFFRFFDKQLFLSGYIIIIMTFLSANEA